MIDSASLIGFPPAGKEGKLGEEKMYVVRKKEGCVSLLFWSRLAPHQKRQQRESVPSTEANCCALRQNIWPQILCEMSESEAAAEAAEAAKNGEQEQEQEDLHQEPQQDETGGEEETEGQGEGEEEEVKKRF